MMEVRLLFLAFLMVLLLPQRYCVTIDMSDEMMSDEMMSDEMTISFDLDSSSIAVEPIVPMSPVFTPSQPSTPAVSVSSVFTISISPSVTPTIVSSLGVSPTPAFDSTTTTTTSTSISTMIPTSTESTSTFTSTTSALSTNSISTTTTTSLVTSTPPSFVTTTTTASSSASLTVPVTTDPPTFPTALIGGISGAVLAFVVLLCVVVIILIVIACFVTRKRSKKYVLNNNLDSDNNGENMILLREISDSGTTDKGKKLDGIFAHIPKLSPISLHELESRVEYLIDGGYEENANEEFQGLSENNREAPCDISETSTNTTKNRYTNILPFDDTRVLLNSKSDYINANYIAGHNNPDEYIATQGPLPHTINSFWQMVWETGCDTIVMVTNTVEAGNLKCDKYWPEVGQALQFNNMGVSNINEEVKPSYTTRTFMLSVPQKKKKSSQSQLATSRECKQYHFTTWPDMGVPMDVATMLRFVKRIRSNLKSTRTPIIIHCSAGVGRTGTFIAVDVQIQRMKETRDVNVKEMVLQLRSQRGFMVQTVAQYLFIYKCLLHEYLYGETEVTKDTIKDHFDSLLETFPDTEDSRMEKEFQGANMIIVPDESMLEAANASQNINKNRKGAGVALDLNRVHLNDPFGTRDDYINASYIGVYGRRAEFIVTQHPLESTTESFWRMMIERNLNSVVIIGSVENKDAYWPLDEPLQFDELEIRLLESEEEGPIKIYLLELESEETEECISVQIFILQDWPSQDVPINTKGILQLSQLVSEHSKGLLVVHTSASTSDQCSGVFCVIHTVGNHLVNGDTVDVMGSTRRALQQRQGSVATKEQYQFIYEALIERTS